MDEEACLLLRMEQLNFNSSLALKTSDLARKFILKVRDRQDRKSGMEAFMRYYDLSTEEGIMLMCIAESLLRIPDTETENVLIRDKLAGAHWEVHLGKSESRFVNLATRGLALGNKILKPAKPGYFKGLWQGLIRKTGEPIVRQAVREAIKVMSEQYVVGRTVAEALKRSKSYIKKGYGFSYDMLGEAAKTEKDAKRYFEAYKNLITDLGKSHSGPFSFQGPSISVKLSALYPRYEFSKIESAIPHLTKQLTELAFLAKNAGIGLTVDAEEADKLEMSLDIFENVFKMEAFQDWPGLGLAVQAYQKRAYPVLEWLIELARKNQKKIPVRLVKGAYWDTEIKLSQVGGFSSYPVFTRKAATDISYLASAKLMISASDAIYSQFATHNAYSVSAILTMMGDYRDHGFEFQNLQGMGKDLHDQLVDQSEFGIFSRIYAPVGSHEDLLPYLVRRLLENGANSSFVNQISDPNIPLETLIENPIQKIRECVTMANTNIPLPPNLYGSTRRNSKGLDISNFKTLMRLSQKVEEAILVGGWKAFPLHNAKVVNRTKIDITNPFDRREVLGECFISNEDDIEKALKNAEANYPVWNSVPLEERASRLEKASDLLEKHRGQLVAMAIREAGKVLSDALAEVREAVDFCRYYAAMALETLAPRKMQGPTGEDNELRMQGRGLMVCISPWNFPIAIFTGQIAAALVAGNTVIAKPAEQTPLVAGFIVELFYEAGIPREVLQFLPGSGETVGAKLVSDARVSGVLFTGSTETARLINLSLAQRPSSMATLIAETGGINALIADSTALPEQLVSDVISSAFGSAGQRCSALRVLFLQEEIADRVITMLAGAMKEIVLGNPQFLQTDLGPVIDEAAKARLMAHAEKMRQEAKLIYRVELPEEPFATLVAPQAYELPDLKLLKTEVFGPILHVIRYRKENLTKVIDDINALGYGLTFGIHSRINETIEFISNRIQAGNIYVNRNMIGAVVGVQAFGGLGLSGTGPKAGGPHYLLRLCHETSIATNTVAMGGNASLMSLEEE